MLGMTRDDMRAFVRDVLDVDEDELTDSVLDRFLLDGYHRVDNYSQRWSFREVTYTFATVPTQDSYSIAAESGNVPGITAPVSSLVDVRGQTYVLQQLDHQQARVYFDQTGSPGAPIAWSKWGDLLYLWPTPQSDLTYTLNGYSRGNNEWIATNAQPDLPDELHELVAWWALSRAYGQQDDLEGAAFYRDEFAVQLQQRARPYLIDRDSPPRMMVGDAASPLGVNMGRLRYDWEN